MLYTYYRAHNILIPTPEELKLGDTRKYVTGALTIAPESGTYFNMYVLDFESLYPGCIDTFNLSYETVRCLHSECQRNLVPGLDYNICTRRRGIYSALTGALRDLRLRVFKPLTKANPSSTDKNMAAASRILKLFLVSCFGVTVRIKGLASPLLGEAITAYGRYVLQSTWDMAKAADLKPKYGDTDSVFLDNPMEQDVRQFIQAVKNRFDLQLAFDRRLLGLRSKCCQESILRHPTKRRARNQRVVDCEIQLPQILPTNIPKLPQQTLRGAPLRQRL